MHLEREEMFYLHVPKTGGQTLATRLASAFDPDKVHMFQGDLEFPQDCDKLQTLLREKEFIESHVAGAMLSEPIDRPILCTIREPVSQMVSNWLDIRRNPDNRWHRAAVSLSPAEFFDNLGEDFKDHQTNYVLSAFVDMRALTDSIGYYRAFNQHLQSGVDRIRWLVPTKSIDAFLDLWSAETKRRVPNRTAMVNVASSKEDVDRARAIVAVRARPHLYAFDQLLYQIAGTRFAEYRHEVEELIAPWSYQHELALGMPNGARRRLALRQLVRSGDRQRTRSLVVRTKTHERGESLARERGAVSEVFCKGRERNHLPRYRRHGEGNRRAAASRPGRRPRRKWNAIHCRFGQPARERHNQLADARVLPVHSDDKR